MKRVILSLILATGWGAAAQAACPAGAITVPVGASIQAAVQAAPTGAKLCLASGVHRGQSVTPKANQTFHNAGAARMNGSKVLTAWTAEGARWFAPGQTVNPPTSNIDECATGMPLCNQALAVYYDDEPLLQVNSKAAVNAGTFWRDRANGRVYIGRNPSGHVVEVTTTQRAFSGSAAGVGIFGLVIEKYGNKLQEAAIHGANASGWTIDGVTVQLNYAVGIDVSSNSTVRNSIMHRNGEMGLAGGGTGIVIENNQITDNGGWAGLDPAWEGGGFKFTEVRGGFVTVNGVVRGTGLDVRGNTITGNKSVGAWIDEGTTSTWPNSGIVIASNDIRNNDSAGVSIEISLGPAKVYGNTLVGNGVKSGWFWGGCVQVYDSKDVEVYGNTCDVAASHGSGMMVISQGGRIANSASGCGNNFHDNTIILRGSGGTTGATGDNLASWCSSNPNRFNNNAYFVATQTDLTRPHWAWHDDEYGWAQWRTTSGQEAQGTITVGLPATTPVPPIPPVDPPPPVVNPPICVPGCVAQ